MTTLERLAALVDAAEEDYAEEERKFREAEEPSLIPRELARFKWKTLREALETIRHA